MDGQAKAKAEEARLRTIEEMEKHGKASNRVRSPNSPVPLRFDEDLGVPIYSIDALKIGKGKDTSLCPFDCDCCF